MRISIKYFQTPFCQQHSFLPFGFLEPQTSNHKVRQELFTLWCSGITLHPQTSLFAWLGNFVPPQGMSKETVAKRLYIHVSPLLWASPFVPLWARQHLQKCPRHLSNPSSGASNVSPTCQWLMINFKKEYLQYEPHLLTTERRREPWGRGGSLTITQ